MNEREAERNATERTQQTVEMMSSALVETGSLARGGGCMVVSRKEERFGRTTTSQLPSPLPSPPPPPKTSPMVETSASAACTAHSTPPQSPFMAGSAVKAAADVVEAAHTPPESNDGSEAASAKTAARLAHYKALVGRPAWWRQSLDAAARRLRSIQAAEFKRNLSACLDQRVMSDEIAYEAELQRDADSATASSSDCDSDDDDDDDDQRPHENDGPTPGDVHIERSHSELDRFDHLVRADLLTRVVDPT